MKRMSCSLSTAQVDKINVCTFTPDFNHPCPRRRSLMTYSFAEVANASDLEGSGGLRRVQFQVNRCPRFFGQGQALPQWRGYVKRPLALHLTINHTENTGAIKHWNRTAVTSRTYQPTSYRRLAGVHTEHWWSSFSGSSQAYTVLYLSVLGACPRRVCLQTNQLQPLRSSAKSADYRGKCSGMNEAMICRLLLIWNWKKLQGGSISLFFCLQFNLHGV